MLPCRCCAPTASPHKHQFETAGSTAAGSRKQAAGSNVHRAETVSKFLNVSGAASLRTRKLSGAQYGRWCVPPISTHLPDTVCALHAGAVFRVGTYSLTTSRVQVDGVDRWSDVSEIFFLAPFEVRYFERKMYPPQG
mgnify:CR=1 FL=1